MKKSRNKVNQIIYAYSKELLKSFGDLNEIKSMKEELDNYIPLKYRNNKLTPQIRKDLVQRIKSIKF